MILNIHSDASYLSARDARIRSPGSLFLGSKPQDKNPIHLNGAISTLCTILKFVATLAAEAELGALFFNTKEANTMGLQLQKLGHPQTNIPIHYDNTTAI